MHRKDSASRPQTFRAKSGKPKSAFDCVSVSGVLENTSLNSRTTSVTARSVPTEIISTSATENGICCLLHPKPAKSRMIARLYMRPFAADRRTGVSGANIPRCRKLNKNRQAQKADVVPYNFHHFCGGDRGAFFAVHAAQQRTFRHVSSLFRCFLSMLHPAACCCLLFLRTLRFMPHEIIIAQAMQKYTHCAASYAHSPSECIALSQTANTFFR